jgi:hypothetical protein
VTPGGLFHSRILERKNHGETGVGLPMVCDLAADVMLSSMPADLYPGQTAENKSRTKSKNR